MTSFPDGYSEEDDDLGQCDGEGLADDKNNTPGCVQYSFVIYTVITGSLCLFGTVGNALAFLVFHVDRLKTSTSFLFQSLSVIDTLMLIGVFPLFCIPNFVSYTGWYASYTARIHPIMLVHVFPFLLLVQTATVWTTVLVGLNRYIAVCMPYQAVRLCTVIQAKRQLAVVLLFSTIYNAPRFAEGQLEYKLESASGHQDHNQSTSTANTTTVDVQGRVWTACAVSTDLAQDQLYRIVYSNVLYTLFVCVLPLVILMALNVRLMSALNDVKRRRHAMTLQSARQRQDNNVTLVLIVVVIVFIFCQFPALLTQIFWTVLKDPARTCGGFQYYFSRVSNVLVTANSAVNFVIYFIFNKRFRDVLRNMLRGRRYPPTGSSADGGAGRRASKSVAQTAATTARAEGVPLTLVAPVRAAVAVAVVTASVEQSPPGSSQGGRPPRTEATSAASQSPLLSSVGGEKFISEPELLFIEHSPLLSSGGDKRPRTEEWLTSLPAQAGFKVTPVRNCTYWQ